MGHSAADPHKAHALCLLDVKFSIKPHLYGVARLKKAEIINRSESRLAVLLAISASSLRSYLYIHKGNDFIRLMLTEEKWKVHQI